MKEAPKIHNQAQENPWKLEMAKGMKSLLDNILF